MIFEAKYTEYDIVHKNDTTNVEPGMLFRNSTHILFKYLPFFWIKISCDYLSENGLMIMKGIVLEKQVPICLRREFQQ